MRVMTYLQLLTRMSPQDTEGVDPDLPEGNQDRPTDPGNIDPGHQDISK